MKALLLAPSLLLTTTAFAQKTYVGTDPITTKNITPWIAKNSTEYAGDYHFGFSECESEFTLKVNKDIAMASKEYTDMSDAAHMHNVVKKFTHVRIAGNKFYSDQGNGEFVNAKEGKNTSRGLKIYKSWSCTQPKGTAEVGIRENWLPKGTVK